MGAEALISQGSMVLIFLMLLAGGLGAPYPEELVVLGAGALVHRGVLPIWTLAVVLAGVMCGDTLLFGIARWLGPGAMKARPFRSILTEARRERLGRILAARGPLVIFGARWVAGLRAPVFALAGASRMQPGRFLFWDGLSLCLYGPTVFGLGYLFSQQLDRLVHGTAHLEHWLFYALAAGFLLTSFISLWSHRKRSQIA